MMKLCLLTVYCIVTLTVNMPKGTDGLICTVCAAGTATSCVTGASTCTATNGWCYSTMIEKALTQDCYGSGMSGWTNNTNAVAGCTTTTALGVTTTTCLCNSVDECNSVGLECKCNDMVCQGKEICRTSSGYCYNMTANGKTRYGCLESTSDDAISTGCMTIMEPENMTQCYCNTNDQCNYPPQSFSPTSRSSATILAILLLVSIVPMKFT